ncbi:MAG TPA: TolC family protein [Opitutaceae bacterium]|nr:TolC family protein [Opitutaceae bacterium]
MRFSFSRTIILVSGVACLSFAKAQTADASAQNISVSAIVAEISQNNPELKFYQEEISAARSSARTAGRLDNPDLALDLGRKRSTAADGTRLGDGAAWSVSVTQTFEWPGRLSLRKAIANRDVALAELGLARFENALTARANTLAYSLYAANTKAEAARDVANRFAALKETFLARDPAGITPLLETRVIEASELARQRRATEAELGIQSALVELNQLRGAPAATPLKITVAETKMNDAPTLEALLAAARENNFEFKARRLELEQQGFVVRLARNERYPAISVRPFYTEENAGDKETTIGVGLSLPLPINGRARTGVDVAEARRRQAEVAALVAQRELEREVITAWQRYTAKLAESRKWTPDAAQRFREAAELADRHYRLGAVPIATYVDLQNSYLDAVEALLETQSEALEAGLKLQQLTGLDFVFTREN